MIHIVKQEINDIRCYNNNNALDLDDDCDICTSATRHWGVKWGANNNYILYLKRNKCDESFPEAFLYNTTCFDYFKLISQLNR